MLTLIPFCLFEKLNTFKEMHRLLKVFTVCSGYSRELWMLHMFNKETNVTG